MELAARVDEYGKPAWIALTILAFIIFWPLGLALLAYVIWSGRMGCSKNRGRWHNMDGAGRRNWWKGDMRRASSGNAAFDEYREDTLRRLEEEQEEFVAFLERLRKAKDKAEFDQFMAERPPRCRPRPGASGWRQACRRQWQRKRGLGPRIDRPA